MQQESGSSLKYIMHEKWATLEHSSDLSIEFILIFAVHTKYQQITQVNNNYCPNNQLN